MDKLPMTAPLLTQAHHEAWPMSAHERLSKNFKCIKKS